MPMPLSYTCICTAANAQGCLAADLGAAQELHQQIQQLLLQGKAMLLNKASTHPLTHAHHSVRLLFFEAYLPWTDALLQSTIASLFAYACALPPIHVLVRMSVHHKLAPLPRCKTQKESQMAKSGR